MKKSLGELKKEQERLREEALKQVADELRLKATEQKIDELRRSIDEMKRRSIEELKRRPVSAPVPLPLPLPAPKVRPELPPPKPGEVRLDVPADALLVVNGKPIAVAPVYRTPPLQPGAEEYVCTFEATVVRDGKNISRVKRLPLRAGAEVRLSFEDMEPAKERWTKTAEAAHFTVRLPADARLTVDDVECPLNSGRRTFDTPSLVPGREYFYVLKAEVVRDGRRIAQTKRVAFRSGDRITVSFEDRGAESLAAQ